MRFLRSQSSSTKQPRPAEDNQNKKNIAHKPQSVKFTYKMADKQELGKSVDLGVFGFMTTPVRTAFKMAGQVVGQIIPSIKPDTPFNPLQPLPPVNQIERRAFDYQVGSNVDYIPRSQEPISAEQLRNLSYNSWVVRGAIETAKDEMCTLKYAVRWKDKKLNKKADLDVDPVIAVATEILRRPDKRLTWSQWSRKLIEDMLVIDAPAYEIWRNVGGKTIGFLNVDGSTIKSLMGKDGRLADSVTEFDPKTGEGNGFTFEEYKAERLFGSIKKALSFYKSRQVWGDLVKHVMALDFSWNVSAKEYVKLYENILK